MKFVDCFMQPFCQGCVKTGRHIQIILTSYKWLHHIVSTDTSTSVLSW